MTVCNVFHIEWLYGFGSRKNLPQTQARFPPWVKSGPGPVALPMSVVKPMPGHAAGDCRSFLATRPLRFTLAPSPPGTASTHRGAGFIIAGPLAGGHAKLDGSCADVRAESEHVGGMNQRPWSFARSRCTITVIRAVRSG